MTDVAEGTLDLELEGLEKVQRVVTAELERVRFEMDTVHEEIRRRSSSAMLQEIRELRRSWEELCRCKRQLERQAASVEGRIQFLTEPPAIERVSG